MALLYCYPRVSSASRFRALAIIRGWDMANSDRTAQSLSMGWAISWVLVVVCFVLGGILAFVFGAPSQTNLVPLQWAGSAHVASSVIGNRAGAFRTALYWDFALILGFTVALLVACHLGRRVFRTAGLLRWALVGYLATSLAVLANLAQNALLLSVLSSSTFEGTWIFRITASIAFVECASLLVAIPIAAIALGTTVSRLWTHKGFVRRWNRAVEAVTSNDKQNSRSVAPLIIPPPPMESATTESVRTTRNGTEKLASEDWGLRRKIDLDASIGNRWWDEQNRSSAPVRFTQDSQLPSDPGGGAAICLSGGGIRSASVALGALQSMRTTLGGLNDINRIVSVSGGGYTNGGIQLALTGRNGAPAGSGGAHASDVFAPGSPEEDHLRRHSSYLSDGLVQWLVALGVLLRNLLASLLIIGLSIAAVGLAIGFFYRHVLIVGDGLVSLRSRLLAGTSSHAPAYPSIPWGVTLGVGTLFALVILLYVVELMCWSWKGSRPAAMARITAGAAIAALLLVTVGIAVPAVVWVSSWLTWHLGISSKPMVAVTSVSAALSYVGVLAAALWRKKQIASTAIADVKKGEKAVTGVFPNSMLQRILIWIALLALLICAVVVVSWVATSGLDDSWWAFLVVGPLVFLVIVLDQTSISLHPFYRRRLASAFAVRRRTIQSCAADQQGVAVAAPYSYDETTDLSAYGGERPGWPRVTFAASANLSGEARTAPGRPSVSYALGADYVGGPEVGWVRTEFLKELVSSVIGKDLTVEAAIAISGAAIASAMGAQTRYYEVFLALTNVRLGAWLPNPRFVALKGANLDDWTVPGLPRIRRLGYFAREIFGIHPDHSQLLLCTDGGHYDNLGLVETLRHRYELIYCFDASGATQPMADTLAGALMLAREELGVEIELDKPENLVAGSGEDFDPAGSFSELNSRLSKSAVISGTINYPKIGNKAAVQGRLIFAQADLTHDLPYDVLEYTQDNPGFPNDGTADQWFDCNRFDAYKRLGVYLGAQAVEMKLSLDR
jgi:hypothetical protein